MNLAIKTDLLPALVSQAVLYKNSWKKVTVFSLEDSLPLTKGLFFS